MDEDGKKYLGESPEVFKKRNLAFGRKLAKVREKHSLSQGELAARLTTAGCAVERMTVSKVERGRHSPSLGMMMALAVVFPKDYRWLMDMGMGPDDDYDGLGRHDPGDLDEAYRLVQRIGPDEAIRRMTFTSDQAVRVSGKPPQTPKQK